MRCAELGLEPDAALPQRRMWLVPRQNRKLNAKECTYIIDYRAQLQLARDTGLVSSIAAEPVYEKDTFHYEMSPEGDSIVKFRFAPDPFADDRGKVRGYFAAARLTGGEVHFVAMSHKQMMDFRAQHAPSFSGKVVGPWEDFPANPAMGVKTVLRRLFNLLPAGQNEAAMRLQARVSEESEIEEGKSPATVAIDLGVSIEEPAATTDGQVEEVLAGKPEPEKPAKEKKPHQREPGEEG
jgi:phage RecT family recombinase